MGLAASAGLPWAAPSPPPAPAHLTAAAGGWRRKSQRQPRCLARPCTRPVWVCRKRWAQAGGCEGPAGEGAADTLPAHVHHAVPSPEPARLQVCEVEVGGATVRLKPCQHVGGEAAGLERAQGRGGVRPAALPVQQGQAAHRAVAHRVGTRRSNHSRVAMQSTAGVGAGGRGGSDGEQRPAAATAAAGHACTQASPPARWPCKPSTHWT